MLDGVPQRQHVPATCPGCAGALDRWRTVPSSEPRFAPARYELWRCGACGTAVTGNPVGSASPADPPGHDPLASGADPRACGPDLHASGSYRRRVPHLHRLARPLLDRFDRERLDLLARLCPAGARVIDAGAGQGRFVARAQAAGYDAWGFDPHPRGTGVARGALETIELPAGRADAVTLWHALEHVSDPGAALRRVHGWLAPGGAVIIAVPNLDSWQARAGGADWFHLDVPRHRTHFTPAGIGRLLHREGFTVLAVQHRLLEHNPFGLWQTALNRIGGRPSWLFALLKGNGRWDWVQAGLCLAAVPLVPLAIAVEALAGTRSHGGTIVVLARRRGVRTSVHGAASGRRFGRDADAGAGPARRSSPPGS